MNNLKTDDDAIRALQNMVDGEPVVNVGIENFHYEIHLTEVKTNKKTVKEKSELEVKLDKVVHKREDIDRKLEELKESYFSNSKR